MLLKIHPDNPSDRKIQRVVEVLEEGGVIIYPTDTVYALACAIDKKKAFEKLCRIKGVQSNKAKFSLIFEDLSQAADYIHQLDTPVFRILKKNLPGPFTFVLKSGRKLPPYYKHKRQIGLRIPDHTVTTAIVSALGKPLLTSSLRSPDEILEYHNDPHEIFEAFKKTVALVIDSGPGDFYPSTIVDMTSDPYEILRQGKGELIT